MSKVVFLCVQILDFCTHLSTYMTQQTNDEKLNEVINSCHRVSNLLGDIYSIIRPPEGGAQEVQPQYVDNDANDGTIERLDECVYDCNFCSDCCVVFDL